MMRRFDFDGALKELFQRDCPELLRRLTGGREVKKFLTVELPRVHARRVDLVLLLDDGSILHIELQSRKDAKMAYRMAEYWLLLTRLYGLRVRQVVLYVGQGRPPKAARLELDNFRFECPVVDIRQIDAEELIRSGNPGDLALAILAGGGTNRLAEILRKAAAQHGPEREELLARILILSGLRGIVGKVELELKHMSVLIDIRKNPVLMRWSRELFEEGKAEGIAEGKAEGKAEVLQEQLEIKFGPAPKWATYRLAHARPAQIERWTKRILTADSLEEVLGRK